MSIRLTFQGRLRSCLLLLCKCSLDPLCWVRPLRLILRLSEVEMLLRWVGRAHWHIRINLLEELLLRWVLLMSIVGALGWNTYLIQSLVEAWISRTLKNWAGCCVVKIHWLLPRHWLLLKRSCSLSSLNISMLLNRTRQRWRFYKLEFILPMRSPPPWPL